MATIRRETRGTSIWAFILIALGVIWLLFQANVISGANLAVLFRLWPLLLIALGLELLIGRNSRSISLLIGGGTVALLLALMIVGPAIGLAPNLDVQTKQLQEPLGNTTSAQLDLGFAVGQATVSALTNSTDLLTADLRYVGGVDYSASGSQGEARFAQFARRQWANLRLPRLLIHQQRQGSTALEHRLDDGDPARPAPERRRRRCHYRSDRRPVEQLQL